MANFSIKSAARDSGVKLWRVAEALGMTDSAFSRKLRHELPPDEKAHIFSVIGSLAAGRSTENGAEDD